MKTLKKSKMLDEYMLPAAERFQKNLKTLVEDVEGFKVRLEAAEALGLDLPYEERKNFYLTLNILMQPAYDLKFAIDSLKE